MNILIIDGHPDPTEERFCHALATAYQTGAESIGHEVRTIRISELNIPCLRSEAESHSGTLPNKQLGEAQQLITWAKHIVIIYPLWLGDVPAYLKAFLEQVLRPDFAFDKNMRGKLQAKSATIIVTMGMPAFLYRWYFWSHSLSSLKRNILKFIGIKPINEVLIGSIKTTDHQRWLRKIKRLGYLGI